MNESTRVPAIPTRIVVGVDGSDGARAATRWAAELASSRGLPLAMFHAVSVPPVPEYGTGVTASQWYVGDLAEDMAAEGLQELEDWADQVRADHPDLTIETKVSPGDAAGELLALVRHDDLLVVGRNGTTGFLDRVVGSVAEELVTHATGPVVVVPDTGESNAVGPVVVGLDARSSGAALELAAWFAGDQRQLHVVTANDVEANSPADRTPELRAQRWRTVRGNQARAVAELESRHPGVRLDSEVVNGNARQVLRSLTGSASLLALGSRGRGGFTGLLLGSTSRTLTRDAACPVLVVRERGDER